MFQRTLLRASRNPLPVRTPIRAYSTQPPPSQTVSSARIARFNRRLPKFLHKYTNALADAPLTHISSFLLLHEITAIVPLFGLAATFHYTHWLPGWFGEGTWVLQGVERFGKYFRRKGWIRDGEKEEAEREVTGGLRMRDRMWSSGEGGTRVVVEFATAYAITKMLLPLRIIFSVWGTPWFARMAIIPAMGLVRRLFGKGKGSPKSGAAGAVVKPGAGKGKDV